MPFCGMASAYRPAFDDQDERDDVPVVYEASPGARSVVPPDPFHQPEYSPREPEPYRRSAGPDSSQGPVSLQQTDSNAPWSQAKADLDDATAKLAAYGSTPKFMRHSEDGRVYSWALRDPATGQIQRSPQKGPDGLEIPGQSIPSPYDTDDLIDWQRDGADLAARRDRVRQAYDKLRPGTDRPEVIQSRINENPPEPGRNRYQRWIGLPAGNGGRGAPAGRAGDIVGEKSRQRQPAAPLASSPPEPLTVPLTAAGNGADIASPLSASPPPSLSEVSGATALDQSHIYQKPEDADAGISDNNPFPDRSDETHDIGGELKARDLAATKALESPPPFGRNAAQFEKNTVTGNILVHERDVQGRWSSPGERQQFIADYNARQIAPLQKAVREDQAMARQILERDGANQSHAARMKQVTDAGGGGTAMKSLSGVKSGFFESLKDAFNNPIPTNTSERIGDALARADGDIPKAIGIIKSTPPRMRSSDFTDAESPFALIASPDEEDLAQAAAGLQGLKDQFDKEGLTPEQQRAVVSDAAKAGNWTEDDTDLVRQLSTGELRINPGFLFGDKQRIIDAINGSGTDDIDKQIALLNLDSARERMQGRLFRDTLTNDSGFQNFANSRWKVGGENDKAAILDAWAAQQKNRAWVFRAGDAVLERVKYATVGLDKTLVGTGAGLLGLAGAGADLVGMDRTKRLALRGAGYLGGVDNDMAGYLQGQKEAAVFRGQTGGFAFTSEVVSAVGQALPMLAGGEIAAGLKGVSQAVVSGMAIYGYGAAQGYEGSISDAITTARDRKGAPLTQEELGGILGAPKTQLGGFVNAIAAAALSKALPNGVERAALGRALPSMTVLDFVKGGGLDAMRNGAFGREILAMGKTLFADAKDQALQGFLNHIVSEVSNAAARGKDIRMGDLLAGAVDSAGVAIATSAVLTQGRATDGRAPGRDVPGGELPPVQIPLVPAAPDAPPAKLGKMPPIYREVFEATGEGMTPSQVAEKLGISGKAVGNILKEIFSTRAAPASTATTVQERFGNPTESEKTAPSHNPTHRRSQFLPDFTSSRQSKPRNSCCLAREMWALSGS